MIHLWSGHIVQTSYKVCIICEEQKDLVIKIGNLIHDLQFSGCPQAFIDCILNSRGSNPENEKKRPGSVLMPNVKGV